jgi:hypothetical protein
MFIQDSLDATIAEAETRHHGWIAGWLDIFKWLATLVVLKIGLDNVFGKNHWTAVYTVLCVGVGTLLGRHTGTVVGDKFIN